METFYRQHTVPIRYLYFDHLAIYLIETLFNTFANRVYPGSTMFAYGNVIKYDPTMNIYEGKG